jgi:Na+/phosphate symporter
MGSIALLNLIGGVALLLWGLRMVRSGWLNRNSWTRLAAALALALQARNRIIIPLQRTHIAFLSDQTYLLAC